MEQLADRSFKWDEATSLWIPCQPCMPEISTGHLHTIRQQCRYGSECITGLAVVLLRDQIVGETWIKAPEMFE